MRTSAPQYGDPVVRKGWVEAPWTLKTIDPDGWAWIERDGYGEGVPAEELEPAPQERRAA